jgi:hypothetical protein
VSASEPEEVSPPVLERKCPIVVLSQMVGLVVLKVPAAAVVQQELDLGAPARPHEEAYHKHG